jgi:aminopeptidase N
MPAPSSGASVSDSFAATAKRLIDAHDVGVFGEESPLEVAIAEALRRAFNAGVDASATKALNTDRHLFSEAEIADRIRSLKVEVPRV